MRQCPLISSDDVPSFAYSNEAFIWTLTDSGVVKDCSIRYSFVFLIYAFSLWCELFRLVQESPGVLGAKVPSPKRLLLSHSLNISWWIRCRQTIAPGLKVPQSLVTCEGGPLANSCCNYPRGCDRSGQTEARESISKRLPGTRLRGDPPFRRCDRRFPRFRVADKDTAESRRCPRRKNVPLKPRGVGLLLQHSAPKPQREIRRVFIPMPSRKRNFLSTQSRLIFTCLYLTHTEITRRAVTPSPLLPPHAHLRWCRQYRMEI